MSWHCWWAVSEFGVGMCTSSGIASLGHSNQWSPNRSNRQHVSKMFRKAEGEQEDDMI